MSDQSARKFRREREAHYRLEAEKEIERKQARLKGFRPFSKAEMTETVLGLPPGRSLAENAAEGVAANMNRAERRMLRRSR